MPFIKPTIPSQLSEIIKIEFQNQPWIGTYTEAEHLDCIHLPDWGHFTVFQEEEGPPVGYFLIRGIKGPHKSLEVKRIAIGPKGQGLGRFCMQWLKEYCFETLQFHRLWLDVFTNNERAKGLYLSEGFKIEGTLRDAIKRGDEYQSLHLLSILEQEYFVEIQS